MNQFLPASVSPAGALTAAPIADGAAFSFPNVASATVPSLRGTTAALPGKHSQAVVTNFCPIKFNALLAEFAR